MVGSWAIPIMFGILFFSTVFSAQDVYGPHYTSLNGLKFDFQGLGFVMTYNISEGLSNPKKSGDFEICITLERVTDSTIPIEIVALNLVSCQPITVTGESDPQNFLLAEAIIPTGPLTSTSQRVDVFGFYEIVNPAGKPMAGETIIDVRDIELGIPACIPPSCSSVNDCSGQGTCVADNVCVCKIGFGGVSCSVPDRCGDGVINPGEQCDDGNQVDGDGCSQACQLEPSCPSECNNHGTCVADDVCVCDNGFHGETCTVPDCTSNEECDDNNSCTLDACSDNGQCVAAPIPGCIPGEQCTSNDQCPSPDECIVGLCDSVGNCQFAPIPGCVVCEPSPEVCDGIDNDCDGTTDEDFVDVGSACSVGMGACQRIGIVVCDSTGTDSMCNVSPGVPSLEGVAAPGTCSDGIDNDCDGFADCNDPDCQGVCGPGEPT